MVLHPSIHTKTFYPGDTAQVCQRQGNEFTCPSTANASINVTCDQSRCPLQGRPMAPILTGPQPTGWSCFVPEGPPTRSPKTSSQKYIPAHHSAFFSATPLQPECPLLPPSPYHLCVAPSGAQDCHYDSGNGGTEQSPFVSKCCCGQCDVEKITCASDSTTGSGLWQPMHSPLCPAEGCGSEGDW